MAITRRTLRLANGLRITVGAEADAATRALTTAWLRAWDELAVSWRAAVDDMMRRAVELGHWPRPTDLARLTRLTAAPQQSEDALIALGQRTGVEVTDRVGRVIAADRDAEAALIASQAPRTEQAALATLVSSRVGPSALDVIVARTTGTITSRTLPLAPAASEAMRRELIRGIALGDNPRTAARAMLRRVEGAFNGGLTRAIVIARTEMLDAYRAAAGLFHQANRDVVSGWTWVADLGPRTCPSCWAMHGTLHPPSEPGPDDHQQGRCVRVPTLTSWAELGISAPEPPSVVPDARAAFDALPESTQLQIMGGRRLELIRTGQVDWSDLAARRDTPGWRPSIVPRPVRDLERLAAPLVGV